VSELRAAYGLDAIEKLNWNESLFGPFPGALEATKQELDNAWMYPEQAYSDFRAAVARWLGTAPERIVPAHGVQALVATVAAVFLERGDAVVVPSPTYGLYRQVSAGRGAEVHTVPLRNFRLDLDRLADQCRDLLESTQTLFEDAADRFFRARVGLGLDEVERWDVSRAFRAPQWDAAFPADKMLPALDKTLGDLGVDLSRQENVELDVEQRPTKTPRAFCAPIDVPGRVVLVIQPVGGPDDWRALFHEAGHTEHFANTSTELPLEWRRLGDNAVTEGWASLFEQLTSEPAWTTRRLDFPRPEEYAAEGATTMLWVARRYAAKLLYELEFHASSDVTELRPRYVELLTDALHVSPSDTDYLADIDAGFYVSSYLRSWAFEAQMREHLRERFDNAWFTKREAGGYLRELWSEGQRLTAEEMIRDVTGGELEMTSIAERIRENVAPLLGR
jgi:hypothetical protein